MLETFRARFFISIRPSLNFIFLALLINLFGCGTVPPLGESLGISPYEDYKVFETQHFRITYTESLADSTMKVATDLELAHTLLSPILRWEPSKKTSVVLLDNTDVPNGLTQVHAGVGIILFLTPPEISFSTSQYDDWVRLLVFHEYTHFLNIDTTRDFWSILRIAFGDSAFPNDFWPSWMHEGLAVYMETRFTQNGRGRSSYYDMILRAAVSAGVLNTGKFVTLDRLEGNIPYFPSGEIRYLFGYQMMNQVARTHINESLTTDGQDDLKDGEDALGLMSYRSAARVPYFINQNLSNIIGKDWYDYWDIWTKRTEERIKRQTDIIQSEPVTQFRYLTSSYEIHGTAISPDGRWLAFGEETLDRRSGLHLLDLQSLKKRRLADKILGSTMAFTPDSQTLIYSSVDRRKNYYLWSDLWAYDLNQDQRYRLTDSLRAKDPDVSPDGNQVVFSVSEKSKTNIAIATLKKNSDTDRFEIADRKILFDCGTFDRSSTPRFTADGKSVLFTLHKNGAPGEDLMSVEIESGKAQTLIANGKLNRYPTVKKDGSIYFVSDVSGVSNLYRLGADHEAEMVTNFITGVAYPAFSPNGDLYAAHFSYSGWNLSKIELSDVKYSRQKLTIESPSIVKPEIVLDRVSGTQSSPEKTETRDYSPWPTMAPRQWFPSFILAPSASSASLRVSGFDTLGFQNYLAGIGGTLGVSALDGFLSYSNRLLGPTLRISVSDLVSNFYYSSNSLIGFDRMRTLNVSVSRTFRQTYSSYTPWAQFNLENESYFVSYPSTREYGSSGAVSSAEVGASFSNTETSRIAISPERGRVTTAAIRNYFNAEPSKSISKVFLSDTEHLPMGSSVWVGSLSGSYVSSQSRNYTNANVVIRGRRNSSTTLLSDRDENGLNELSIRGYPDAIFYVRGALLGSLDFRFPIKRIYRGSGTIPFFLNYLYGFTFGEMTYLPFRDLSTSTLPAFGGGVGLTTEVSPYWPLTFRLQYHRGLAKNYGGKEEVFLEAGLFGASF